VTLAAAYGGKNVLVTGDTGFVGTWLRAWLERLGANVRGLSLPSDVASPWSVRYVCTEAQPEVVFHLAAQAIVSQSYANPLRTIHSNVLGTTSILEVIRHVPSVRACVIVTSDKCYAPSAAPHSETDPLGGNDIYSASKAAAELITNAYRRSFLDKLEIGVATARAGNLIGGGDWGVDRVVPDYMRAVKWGTPLVIRNPESRRPWQHVLEACAGYLQLGAALLDDPERFSEAWNFGPHGTRTVRDLLAIITAERQRRGLCLPGVIEKASDFAEESRLCLNAFKAHQFLGWQNRLLFDEAVAWTVEGYQNPGSMTSQVDRYARLMA
jgi:CDP-glucose 4,6-dehydratase